MDKIESADPARNFKLILVGRKKIQCDEWEKLFSKYKNVSGTKLGQKIRSVDSNLDVCRTVD